MCVLKERNCYRYDVTIGLCARDIAEIEYETVNSLIHQDFPFSRIELVLVLGKTEHVTNKMRELLSEANITVKMYCDSGAGLATARQIVVEKAQGEFIVWVDSDVSLSRDFLRKQLEFMRSNASMGVAIGFYDNKESRSKLAASVFDLQFGLFRGVYFGATITRASALKEVNGFDRRIKGASEDVDIVMRLVYHNWGIAFNENARFSRNLRESLQDVLRRGMWYGRGGHFLNHKYESLSNIPFRLPPIYFIWGLKLSKKAYRKNHTWKSFIIPLITSIQSIGWSIGFITAHFAGYGHSILKHEISKQETRNIGKRMSEILSY